jgi:hypothetical protein
MRIQRAIEKYMPNGYLWLFYTFNSEYSRQPVDLDDLIDGLSCIWAKNEAREIMHDE